MHYYIATHLHQRTLTGHVQYTLHLQYTYKNTCITLTLHLLHNYRTFTEHLNCSVDKKNQLDVTFCILYFYSNSCSTCFGQPCAHHQELTSAWCYSLVLVCAVAAGRWSSPVGSFHEPIRIKLHLSTLTVLIYYTYSTLRGHLQDTSIALTLHLLYNYRTVKLHLQYSHVALTVHLHYTWITLTLNFLYIYRTVTKHFECTYITLKYTYSTQTLHLQNTYIGLTVQLQNSYITLTVHLHYTYFTITGHLQHTYITIAGQLQDTYITLTLNLR